MRENKFRAWDKLNGEMVYSDEKQSDYGFNLDNGVVRCYVECVEVDVCGDEYIDYDYLDNIMQYTGLKDVNGIEIYEGDIVKVTRKHWNNCNKEYLEKTTKELGIIEFFKNLQMSLKVKEEGYDLYQPLLWILEDDSEIKIIGNIYENSELLKGE